MTERKPRGMSFTSWIDQQIADAEKRGVFDNLPGAGKPLELKKEADADYGQAWVRDYARREGVPPEEFLPTPLRLRREIERLTEAVAEMGSEQEVRDTVADLNRRILEWRRIPVGPPIFVRLADKDDMVRRWRAARAARPSPPSAGEPADQAGETRLARAGRKARTGARPARPRWWRRRARGQSS
jgi:hypothetical protein